MQGQLKTQREQKSRLLMGLSNMHGSVVFKLSYGRI